MVEPPFEENATIDHNVAFGDLCRQVYRGSASMNVDFGKDIDDFNLVVRKCFNLVFTEGDQFSMLHWSWRALIQESVSLRFRRNNLLASVGLKRPVAKPDDRFDCRVRDAFKVALGVGCARLWCILLGLCTDALIIRREDRGSVVALVAHGLGSKNPSKILQLESSRHCPCLMLLAT
jgi:hypothetical protein